MGKEARANLGLPPAYQIAYVSPSVGERLYAQDEFAARTPDLRLAWQKNSLEDQNGYGLVFLKPDMIIISASVTEGSPPVSIHESIENVRDLLGNEFPILVRAELEEDDGVMSKDLKSGVHLVDYRLDFAAMVDAIGRIRSGEHVIACAQTSEDTERYDYWMGEIDRKKLEQPEEQPSHRERLG